MVKLVFQFKIKVETYLWSNILQLDTTNEMMHDLHLPIFSKKKIFKCVTQLENSLTIILC